MLYDYLHVCKINHSELCKPESLLNSITANSSMLNMLIGDELYKTPTIESTYIVKIILNIRRSQVSIKMKEFRQAWLLTQKALEGFIDWCLKFEANQSTPINRLPNLMYNIYQVIDELNDELTILCDIQCEQRHHECHISPSPTSSSDPEQGAAVDDNLFAELSLKDRNSKVEKDSDAL